MHYDNFKYAHHRLKNSIVNTKEGFPILVQDVVPDLSVIAKTLKEGLVRTFFKEEIDLTPVRLGWVNHKEMSFFLVRKPLRKWCQGLNHDNMMVVGENLLFSNWPYKNIAKTIMGEYPEFEEALYNCKKQHKTAFSRDFAINNDHLFYSGRVVGSNNSGKIVLDPTSSYLQERLEKAIGN